MKICRPCAVCGREGISRCKNCRILYYCSREHQEHDWRNGHKENCKIFSIKTNETVGRHLVARRDFPPGSIVLVEEPLISTPSIYTKPVCLGCYGDVGPKSPTCGKCGWPVCSAKCADSPLHKPECKYSNIRRLCDEKRGKFDKTWMIRIREFDVLHPMYQAIPLLRGLYLRDSGDPAWEKFINLESHQEARRRKGHEVSEGDETRAVKFVVKFFYLRDSDETDLRKIYGILMINGHEVPRYAEDFTERTHVEVYENASLLEHSCIPNCAKRFPVAGGIEIRAVTYVPKGSSLTISYTDPLWGTMDRQKDLCLNKYFFCSCPRCKDPTELGTFMSGVKCRSCQDGYLLPFALPNAETMHELERLDAYEFQCVGKPVADASKEKGCGNVLKFNEAYSFLEKIGHELSTLRLHGSETTQQFLRTHSNKTLHRNHHYLVSARFGLVRMMKTNMLSMDVGATLRDPPEVQLLVKTCQDLLEIIDIITPGATEFRGMLLYEMTSRYVRSLIEKYRKGNYPKTVDKDKVFMFREATAIMSISASTGNGAIMAEAGRKLMIEYDELLQKLTEQKKKPEKKVNGIEAQSSSQD